MIDTKSLKYITCYPQVRLESVIIIMAVITMMVTIASYQ